MNEYEVIFESLQNQLDQGLITYELAEEVNDLAYDKYVVESDSNDPNHKYIDELVKSKNTNHTYSKKVRRLVKDKKYNQAIAVLKKEQKELDDIRKTIKKIDCDVFDSYMGTLVALIIDCLKYVALSVAFSIGVDVINKHTGKILSDKATINVGSSIAKGKVIGDEITDVVLMADRIYKKKNKGKKITPADFNLFKNRVISSINIMTNKIDKKIKELEKAK